MLINYGIRRIVGIFMKRNLPGIRLSSTHANASKVSQHPDGNGITGQNYRLHYSKGKNNKGGSLKIADKAVRILQHYEQFK